jgi:hypothetical protein
MAVTTSQTKQKYNTGHYYNDKNGKPFLWTDNGAVYDFPGSDIDIQRQNEQQAKDSNAAADIISEEHANNPDSESAKVSKITIEKIKTLYKTNPSMAKYVANTLCLKIKGINDDAISQASVSIDANTRLVLNSVFRTEKEFADKVSKSTSAINQGIQQGVNKFTGALKTSAKNYKEAIKPMSVVTGTTIGTMTHILKDPTGAPEYLSRALGEMIKKTNPDFYYRMEATLKKHKMDNLKNLPDQVVGSIKHVISAIDAVLTLPVALISDLYNGLMDVMQQISSAIDQIEASVQKYIFGPEGILDSTFPGLSDLLEAVNEVSGVITGISQTFSGANNIAATSLQVTSYVNQFNGFISNPLNLAFAYAPPVISQGLYAIQNPQNIINQYLPPELSQGFAKLSQMTGFGFNGNMGYGLQSVLDGLKDGVIHSVLSNYSKQYAMLTPLVNLSPGVKTASVPLNTPYPVTVIKDPTNSNLSLSNGIPYSSRTPKQILSTK